MSKIRWLDSLLRAIIAGLAGIGVACVTNHLTRRPNAAYFASIVATGAIVAVLNREARSEPSETPPEESGKTSAPKMPIPPLITPDSASEPAATSPYPERHNPPLRNDSAPRPDALTLRSETSSQSSSTTTQ